HTRCVEAGLFQCRLGLCQNAAFRFPFRTIPGILVIPELCAQSSFDDGILRSTVLHQLSRHGLEHVKKSETHIRRLAQEGADITDGSVGVLGIVNSEENSHYRTPSLPAFFFEVSSRRDAITDMSSSENHECAYL